jgi:hypothetical protein
VQTLHFLRLFGAGPIPATNYFTTAVSVATESAVGAVVVESTATAVESVAVASLLGEPQATIPTANNTVNAPILALDTKVVKRLALYNAFDVKKSRFCSD